MKKKFMGLILAMTVVIGCMTGCGGEKSADSEAAAPAEGGLSGTVATDGSTSMEKVIGALGESFMAENPGTNFTYNPTGSGSGISAVENGTCDIGLSSRHLKDEETAKGLKETVLAIDGIAVIVNTANGVADLTVDQIAKVYTGEITNWSELGGNDAAIVVIGREAGSGTRDGFESITGTSDACKLNQELTSTGDVIATVKSNENAIGYASLASVGDDTKTLLVEGIEPSATTILDGSYKIQRPFVLVTKEGQELTPVAKAFMDYALSDAAKAVIEGAGVVPAK